jgi:hypothetical protein
VGIAPMSVCIFGPNQVAKQLKPGKIDTKHFELNRWKNQAHSKGKFSLTWFNINNGSLMLAMFGLNISS